MAPHVRIDPTTVFKRSDEPVTAEVDGTVVMMSLGRGKYFGLDTIGTRVWELLATPISVAGIRDALLADYDVEPNTCERDVTELLENMLGEELVSVQHAETA